MAGPTEIKPQDQGPTEADKFRAYLAAEVKPAIKSLLPKHLTAERILRLVFEEALKPESKLLKCKWVTILECLITAAQLGLEVGGPFAGAYLIPRFNKDGGFYYCTMLVSYRGLIDLAQRSGMIADITANVVYGAEVEAGLFEAEIEPARIVHRVALRGAAVERTDDDIVAAYCVVRTTNGGRYQRILTRAEINARRSRSGERGFSPWKTDFAAMARKSAIRALFQGGTVPMSTEIREVEHRESEWERMSAPALTGPTEQGAQQRQALVDHGDRDDDSDEREPDRVVIDTRAEEPAPKASGLPLPPREPKPAPTDAREPDAKPPIPATLLKKIATLERDISPSARDGLRARCGIDPELAASEFPEAGITKAKAEAYIKALEAEGGAPA